MKDDKSRSHWFKRRRYGYGWTPIAWQGWLTVLAYLTLIIFVAVVLLEDTPRNTFSVESYIFLAFIAASTGVILVISRLKGPKPKWRWGRKPNDNPKEDI